MEKLLKWSIESANHDPSSGKPAPRPDEKALSELFSGTDDSQLMVEAVKVAANREASVEDKETALDNLEMLVENLDNANNMENIGLWHPLIEVLSKKDEDNKVKTMICWVFGTAVQNNEKAQNDLVSKEGAVECLIDASQDPDVELSSKALYALSSLLGHCEDAYKRFAKHNGWSILESTLSKEDVAPKMVQRVLSVLFALSDISPIEEKYTELRSTKIILQVLRVLGDPKYDNAHEKALSLLSFLSSQGFALTDNEKKEANEVRDALVKDGRVESGDLTIA